MYFCSLYPGWVNLNSSLGRWISNLTGNLLPPCSETKTKAAGNSVYWLCVFPSEVVPLPDHKQDLCIFSFHSLWVILIEASAAVPVTSGRGTLGMFWFQAPYFSAKGHLPLYINTVLLIVYLSDMMPWVYLAGTCQNTACLMFKQKPSLERRSVRQRVCQSTVWKYAAA